MTPEERLLWSQLKSARLGVSFRRQEVIGQHVVDFVCYPARLVVELNGSQHLNSETDRVRDTKLGADGFIWTPIESLTKRFNPSEARRRKTGSGRGVGKLVLFQFVNGTDGIRITVLRFWNNEVRNNLEGVLERISEHLKR